MTICPYTKTEGPEKLFLAEAKMALERARALFPKLSPSGFVDVPGDFNLEGIACAIEFLRGLSRAPAKRGVGSYGLKHVCERWCGRYISNGELLVGAAYVGLEMLIPMDGPNAYIGVDKRQLNQIPAHVMYNRMVGVGPTPLFTFDHERRTIGPIT